MINVTKAYREACENPIRKSYIVVKYGLYDKSAKSKISRTEKNAKIFSQISQTYDEIKQHSINYITCEPNRVKLDGTFAFLVNKSLPNKNETIGYWSEEMSNSNGLFDNNPSITYIFNDYINFTDLTLYFQELVDSINIKYYLDNNLIYNNSIINNKFLNIETKSNGSQTANYFNKLTIEFVKTGFPNRYVKFNEIDFGIYEIFDKNEIKEIDIIEELSIDSSELSANSLNLTIKDDKGEYDILNPYNKLSKLQEKQELTCYHYLKVGNNFKEVPLGTFLLKNIKNGKQEIMLECYDDTYFMNKIYYGSKFYINEEVENVLKDLFTYFNYTKYVIDDELKGTKISGYIPEVQMREALRLIAEASKSVISKTREGITYIYKTNDPKIKLFKTYEYENPQPQKNLYNNVIDVNVYNYETQSDDVILYSANMNIGEYIISFKNYPLVYDLYKNNFNLLKNNNNNYDIIELGATSCKIKVSSNNELVELKGKYYIESKKVERIKKDNTISVDEYAIAKINNNLITDNNYKEIANWKLNRKDVKHNFECMATPYIEVGDTCSYQLKYNNLQGEKIKRDFVVTYINFTNSLKQTIEGE